MISKVLQRLCSDDRHLGISDIESAVNWLAVNPFPSGISAISLRAGLLHYSRQMTTGSLLTCLDLFSKSGIPDHLFFKEVGRILLPTVPELSVSDICRLLQAHVAVGVSESQMFTSVFARLSTVINRANLSQIRHILDSISRLDSKVLDCVRLAELCLNRYSLGIKATAAAPIEIDRDILTSMARMRMRNSAVLRRIRNRIVLRFADLSLPDLISVMTSLTVLDSEVGPLWIMTKRTWLSDLHSVSDPNLASLVAVAAPLGDTQFVLQAAAVYGSRIVDVSTPPTRHESVLAYKHLFALRSVITQDNSRYMQLISGMSADDLRGIESILTLSESLVPYMPHATHLKSSLFDLQPACVGGILGTNLIEVHPRTPVKRDGRKCRP